MSDFYHVKALKKTGMHLQVQIITIHPDILWIYEKKNFALQLIWDAALEKDKRLCALTQSITDEEIADIEHILDVEDEYIKSVRILKHNGKSLENYNGSIFREQNKDDSLEALMEITATSLEWIEHIDEQQKWTSAAYDMESLL